MEPTAVTHEALNAWARTVPPHSLWWVSDDLWDRIWWMLEANARCFDSARDSGYRYPLISWRMFHENVRIGRMSARSEYLEWKGWN